ncbi:MAG: hypothetical protein GY861_21565 [bacterium]|nr:hypothetical protein [bacterium]
MPDKLLEILDSLLVSAGEVIREFDDLNFDSGFVSPASLMVAGPDDLICYDLLEVWDDTGNINSRSFSCELPVGHSGNHSAQFSFCDQLVSGKITWHKFQGELDYER